MELPEAWFSRVGMRKTDRSDLYRGVAGKIQIWGVDQDGIMMSDGNMDEIESQKTKHIGLMGYKISTVPGFSGSPLVANRNGQPCIVGVHACGDFFHRSANYGINTLILQKFFRKHEVLPRIEVIDLESGRYVDAGMSTSEQASAADPNDLEIDFDVYENDERYEAALNRARDLKEAAEHDQHLVHGQQEDGVSASQTSMKSYVYHAGNQGNIQIA